MIATEGCITSVLELVIFGCDKQLDLIPKLERHVQEFVVPAFHVPVVQPWLEAVVFFHVHQVMQ